VPELHLAPLALPQQLALPPELLGGHVEVHEDGDLGAEDVGVEGLEHVVHRPRRVPLEDVLLLLADRRQEDDGRVAATLGAP
jgi:hypothetical protein